MLRSLISLGRVVRKMSVSKGCREWPPAAPGEEGWVLWVSLSPLAHRWPRKSGSCENLEHVKPEMLTQELETICILMQCNVMITFLCSSY